jgi:hypothetical protein
MVCIILQRLHYFATLLRNGEKTKIGTRYEILPAEPDDAPRGKNANSEC